MFTWKWLKWLTIPLWCWVMSRLTEQISLEQRQCRRMERELEADVFSEQFSEQLSEQLGRVCKIWLQEGTGGGD